MKKISRKTKIVCTLGPSTDSKERIKQLIVTGMDVARLNFSHGDHATHGKVLSLVRQVAQEVGVTVGVLQDLGGPKIRIGNLGPKEVELKTDDRVALAPEGHVSSVALPVNYPYIIEDVKVGDRILLADGLVELEVEAKEPEKVLCRVILGGKISSHRGVNLPLSNLRISAFTEKDKKDLLFGLGQGVDFVALSFVRHAKDLEPVRDIIDQSKNSALLIAKIEKPEAMERLESILDAVDGVMVARGDLGVEMPLEDVPVVQKKIIRAAGRAGKPVITATQMLRSMVDSPRPTRAEATDVANAVLDGTDALMLSEETAIGEYPVEAVTILNRIARATEKHLHGQHPEYESLSDRLPVTATTIARSACIMAEDLDAAAIVACTSSGSTARLVARFRPSCPVLGLTPNPDTARQLTMSWGVIPVMAKAFSDTDDIFHQARQRAREYNIAGPGGKIVVTAGAPPGRPGTTDLVKVIEV